MIFFSFKVLCFRDLGLKTKLWCNNPSRLFLRILERRGIFGNFSGFERYFEWGLFLGLKWWAGWGLFFNFWSPSLFPLFATWHWGHLLSFFSSLSHNTISHHILVSLPFYILGPLSRHLPLLSSSLRTITRTNPLTQTSPCAPRNLEESWNTLKISLCLMVPWHCHCAPPLSKNPQRR